MQITPNYQNIIPITTTIITLLISLRIIRHYYTKHIIIPANQKLTTPTNSDDKTQKLQHASLLFNLYKKKFWLTTTTLTLLLVVVKTLHYIYKQQSVVDINSFSINTFWYTIITIITTEITITLSLFLFQHLNKLKIKV